MTIKRSAIRSTSTSPLINRKRTAKRRGRVIFIFILSIVMVFSGSLFYVWSRLEAVNLSYEISRQARLRKKLIQLNERLTLEVATLKSPDRIGKIAREDLGMVVSRKGQTKVIANGY